MLCVQVLKSLLSSVVGTVLDEELSEASRSFATGVARHYAMLFAAGARTPPPAPLSSLPSTVEEGERGSSTPVALLELDPLLFIDALVEVFLQSPDCFPCWPREHAVSAGPLRFVGSVYCKQPGCVLGHVRRTSGY